MAFTLVYIDLFSLQILISQSLSMIVVIYLYAAMPMKEDRLHRIDFVNEAILMIMTDTIFLYTDWVMKPVQQDALGWLYIALFISLFAYNFLFFLRHTIVEVIKDCRLKRRRAKLQEPQSKIMFGVKASVG